MMKRMLLMLFAAMLCISMMGFAQTTDPYGSGQQTSAAPATGADHSHMKKMDPQEMVNHLDQQLTLTADQKSKITTILENSNKHSEELMSNSTGDKKADHEAMRQLHDNTHAQIRATLNPDQQTKFDAMMKEQMSKHDHSSTAPETTTESPK